MRSRIAVAMSLLGALVPLSLAAQDMPEANVEALKAYVSGLEHYVASENEKAIPLFLHAYDLDPNFDVALMLAGVSQINAGNRAEGAALFSRVRPERLSEYYRLRMEAVAQVQLRGDLPRALEASRRMAEMAPGTKAAYNYANNALRMNRPDEALDALMTLDPSGPAVRGWLPYWTVLAAAYHSLGRHDEELQAAVSFRKQFPDAPEASVSEAAALVALGRASEIEPLLHHAEARSTGATYGTSMVTLANEMMQHGQERAAREMFKRAVGWFEARPASEKDSPAMTSAHGWALYQAGRAAEALPFFGALTEKYADNVVYQGRLGVVEAKLGHHAAAKEVFTRLETFRQPYLNGANTFWRAHIAAALGDPDRAARLLGQAMNEGQLHGMDWHRDATLRPYHANAAIHRFVTPQPPDLTARGTVRAQDLEGTWELVSDRNLTTGAVDPIGERGLQRLQITRSHWSILNGSDARPQIVPADLAELPPGEVMKQNYAMIWNEKNEQLFAARAGSYMVIGDTFNMFRDIALYGASVGNRDVRTIVHLDGNTLILRNEAGERTESTWKRIG